MECVGGRSRHSQPRPQNVFQSCVQQGTLDKPSNHAGKLKPSCLTWIVDGVHPMVQCLPIYCMNSPGCSKVICRVNPEPCPCNQGQQKKLKSIIVCTTSANEEHGSSSYGGDALIWACICHLAYLDYVLLLSRWGWQLWAHTTNLFVSNTKQTPGALAS